MKETIKKLEKLNNELKENLKNLNNPPFYGMIDNK